jgi:hypothetical protein
MPITDCGNEFIVGGDWGDAKAFLEVDDATAYLYACDGEQTLVALHIANKPFTKPIQPSDVEVLRVGCRFGVMIHGRLRGVVDLNGDYHRPANTLEHDGVTEPK